MAKSGVRARPRARNSRSRSTGRRAVGRRRQGPSIASVLLGWLISLETAGAIIVLWALAMSVWLVAGRDAGPIDAVAKASGVLVFVLAAAVALVGVLVWRRDLGLLLLYPRVLLAAAPAFLFMAGILSIARPDWRLGSESLAAASAGGELGRLLLGSPFGVAGWLASGTALVVIAFPLGVRATLLRTPGAIATVWSWQVHRRLLHIAAAVFDFAFPTKPPPDERPSQSTPSWLPDEDEGDDLVPAPAEIPDERMRQGQLPVNWWEGDEEQSVAVPAKAVATAWKLPPMDLLAAAVPADEAARPDNALRASLIVDTLASFGVDSRVAQYHEGPVVTQFDVEPGWEIRYKQVAERDRDGKPVLDRDGKPKMHSEEVSRTRVRVNQITSLSNDLALALAAPSLRIEAPVPGRSVVGIEVPNSSASVVTLRSVIETPAFQRLASRTKLALPLGKSVSGEPVVADLARMPHLLIAGATGSGKSVCMNSIIASLLVQCPPEDVRFVMIDPKRVELAGFSMIPHLAFSNIVVDVEKVVGTLGAVLHEMEARYKRFASLAVRNIDSYNKHPKVTEKLPYWVVIIDELADLMMAAPFEVERQICRLAQLARATGIHLILATQRPSVDVVTGLIKANFPTRIAFAMTAQVDSRTILDMAGAERLLGRGDMLYMPTDSSKPKRVQGVFLSDQEIDRLVSFWGQQRATHSTPVYDHLLSEALQAIEEEEDADPMYERAKALAEEHNRVSTSMLQRRLRIGYPRAARLMDRLEEEGIVGGGAGGGSSREVTDDRDDDLPGFRPPRHNAWSD